MKTRFSTLDICAMVTAINERAVGLRLVNVYDIDNKTYLFKLAKPDVKAILLVESGIRIHFSEFDWPKNNMPSGFAMKMRKHLRGRRLVSASQLGIDRIIDLQFGSDEAAYHVFVELYDKGNIALTDHQYIVLNLLRFRKDTSSKVDGEEKEENDDVKFAVHQPYPYQAARLAEPFMQIDRFVEIMKNANKDSFVKRILNPHLPYGAPCIEHCLCVAGFSGDAKLGKDFMVERDATQLHSALIQGENFINDAKTGKCKGFLIQKYEKKSDGELLTNIEFHPFLFEQHKSRPHREFPTFNQAVDEFFGSLASQKNDMKALQRERAAFRKLDNVRRDHENRLQGLRNEQDEDRRKAWIIEGNLDLVDQAIKVICSAIANQVDWDEIKSLVADAQAKGDKVAMAIKSLKLETNTMTMLLSEPSLSDDDSDFLTSSDEDTEDEPKQSKTATKSVKIDIDLSVSAYANVQSYYNKKRHAAQKEQRTMDASSKALKSAEKKTKQTLKEAAAIQSIQKARKVFWFEKFLWFISSENYLVLGGRDAQQNELLVKKYLNVGDVYVHADLHGATSCIIKNPSGCPVPPKSLNEAGTMAICHSAAWDAKVVTSAWWVHHDQVSKTAPSGEYLTTGSFLIRGKKNYLPPSYLVYGFGFLFKVDETCVWKHKGERKVRSADDDLSTLPDSASNHETEGLDLMSEEEDLLDDAESTKLNPQTGVKNNVEEEEHAEFEREDNLEQGDNITEQVEKDNDRVASRKDAEVDQEEQNVQEEVNSDAGSDVEYPDTLIQIPYNLNDKYELSSFGLEQKNESSFSPTPSNNQTESKQEKPRLSAKQKREQKKLRKQQLTVDEESHENPVVSLNPVEEIKAPKPEKSSASQPSLKRGQKKKMRKIKEKYKDQDEEDRKLMMEILQSAKPPKIKEKKGKNKQVEVKKAATIKPNVPKPKPVVEKAPPSHTVKDLDPNEGSDEERELVLKAEHLNVKEVDDILDSLTGIPAQDDSILFAIPVCAPYNTMQNYKFKVKLTPGTGKKGKAAKTAISMFQLSRDTTQHEKDHLRSVKDHDLSRNMPGKVKVSAPNLQKQKFKGKRR